MRRAAPSALLLVLGIVAVQLVRSEVYVRYVKPALGPWLVLTGCLLAGVGALGLLVEDTRSRGHGLVPPRVGWLLLVPVSLIVLITPPALTSYGLRGRSTPVSQDGPALGALPAAQDGAVELTLADYARRALFGPTALRGVRLRLVGFAVAPTAGESAQHGRGFYLTRIALSCCAADGQAIRVFVAGVDAPPNDSWWTVEGQLPASALARPAPVDGGQPDVEVQADTMTAMAEPTNPYTTT